MRNYLFYSGDIEPDNETVFVYGTNPENRHGKGAAIIAAKYFGALYGRFGIANALQGKSFGIVTQDLKKHKLNPSVPSVSKEEIIQNIVLMFKSAKENTKLLYKVAYRHLKDVSLSNYTGYEFMDMFNEAMKIESLPDNVIFSEEWYKSKHLNLDFYE